MARIRSIKPEFWTDEKVVAMSPLARLLFVGMWNFVDDEGRAEYSPTRLKMQILPADSADISELLGEIRGASLINVYSVAGKDFFEVRGFKKHQKVDHRVTSKLPPPPNSPEPPRNVPPDQGGDQGEERIKEQKERGGAEAPTTFAFSGSVIRLSELDMARWRKSYPRIPDIVAELTKADDYYRENPPPEGKWFFPVSRWLSKANQEAAGGSAGVRDKHGNAPGDPYYGADYD